MASRHAAGFGWRLWYALQGINHGLDRAYHKATKRFWAAVQRKVDDQHKSVQYAYAAVKGLAQALAITFWDLKDEIHIGARWGWIEGGHRHREWHELRNARREHGTDHPDYATARQEITEQRADRKRRYELYATDHTKASNKGQSLPRLRDSVEPSAKPVIAPKKKPEQPCCAHHGGDEMACPCGCHPWNQNKGSDPLVATPDGPVADFQPKASLAPVFQAPPTPGEPMPPTTGGELTTGGTGEVTNTIALRALYEHHLMTAAANAESLAAFAANLRAQTTAYEQAIAWMSADQFDQPTIANATAIQERFTALSAKVDEASADFAELVGALQQARTQSLASHAHIEEAVSGGAAKSTASYQGG